MTEDTEDASMENLTIKNNQINEGVLEEIKSVLIAPMDRKVVLIVILTCAAMVLSVINSGQLGWIPVILLVNVFYIYGQPAVKRRKLIDRMVKGMKKTYGRPYCTFDVTFEEENIKSINVSTRETVRMPYADFRRIKKAKYNIAMVTKQGQMVVIDRTKMDEGTEKQVLAILADKCVNLRK